MKTTKDHTLREFDRSISYDEYGNEIESMGNVCNKCGKKESSSFMNLQKR